MRRKHRKQLAKALKRIYDMQWFWDIWKTKGRGRKSAEKVLEEKMLKQLESIGSTDGIVEYLNTKIVLYLKQMTFDDKLDTEQNRYRLIELVNIKNHIAKARRMRDKRNERISQSK